MVARSVNPSGAGGVLVGLRGNSGSGKTTVARAVQQRFARASCLVVAQDVVRRTMLRETDAPGAVNIDLIEHVAAFGLARGLIVIVEGILDADRYGEMLERLSMSAGSAMFYSFDLSFAETVRRHASRPQAQEFSPTQMGQWYHGWQPLAFVDEVRIDASWQLETVVDQIVGDICAAGLFDQQAARCQGATGGTSPPASATPRRVTVTEAE
ncbi:MULTISPECIES: AAA family ATPase [Nocardia]|uniref:AAA family ATPase n=1 Tax=Nocardia thailandica TaxID=257275 RepID=A0ABW6PW89_9NOCA|nr:MULTISPECIES: AAA family ATPase [Nocardia]